MQTASELRKCDALLDYPSDKERIKKFLLFFTEDGVSKYLEALRLMKDSILIDLNDVSLFDETGLAQRFEQNASSYVRHTVQAIDEILYEDMKEVDLLKDQRDAFLRHRVSKFKERFSEKELTDVFPGFLIRNYVVHLRPHARAVLSVRDLASQSIGKLVSVRGVVTRVSSVKPSIRVATYVCSACGAETYQQVNGDAFDLLEECASEKCRVRNVRGTLTLLSRGSKFVRMQTIHLQELTGDTPHGCIPRLLAVECYGDMTERSRPGECLVLSGVFLPRPYYGFQRMRAGLLNDTYLLAMHTDTLKVSAQPVLSTQACVISLDDLLRSFAPEIFQMDETKRILLLMLVGAPPLVRADGMRVRGDINVLLLGDPGIAKSQLLKTAAKVSKRGVYVTGRGSSGVGLTASVSKDQATGEVVLDGGALVLSDGGVCCIDELDKMNETDRVAIHEVMEQQSISISKAGINTTLNARCAVLAAANPVRGRYDPKRTVEQNSGLPCSLLSRFDVVCLLQDQADAAEDTAMAEHVTGLHCGESGPADAPLNYAQLRCYIEGARELVPVLPGRLRERMTEAYMGFRREGATPRVLLALIRLSMAHARLRFSQEVSDADVDVAISIMDRTVVREKRQEFVSEKHSIYNFITSLISQDGDRRIVRLEDLWSCSVFKREMVEEVISAFETAGIWLRNNEELEMIE